MQQLQGSYNIPDYSTQHNENKHLKTEIQECLQISSTLDRIQKSPQTLRMT